MNYHEKRAESSNLSIIYYYVVFYSELSFSDGRKITCKTPQVNTISRSQESQNTSQASQVLPTEVQSKRSLQHEEHLKRSLFV